MKHRRGRRIKKCNWYKLVFIPIFILLSFGAIRLGLEAGDMIFHMDSKIVKDIDTENFKSTLNRTLPIIDTVYNSGNVDFSLSGQISNLIKEIFSFDLGSPLTILNAQSSFFSNYYKTGYPLILGEKTPSTEDNKMAEGIPDLQQNNENEPNKPDDPNNQSEKSGEDNEKTGNDKEGEQEGEQKENKDTGYISDASSISFDEADEEKDLTEEKSVSSGKITIQNKSKFKITKEEIDKLLKEPLKFEFDRKGPKILIYHTHTTESYLRNIDQLNKKDIPSYSSDPKYNVVRVGEELTKHLEKDYNIDVIHNGTVHNSSHNSAYSNSLRTIDKYLKSYPSIKITLDIHRDGLASDKPKLRVVTDIGKKKVAKVMFVVGTNGTGLSNPNWKENLKLAIKLQDRLNAQHPGLTKPIWISDNRYNQHLAKGGGLIIEVGADGNTLEEVIESTKYIAKAINDVINTK